MVSGSCFTHQFGLLKVTNQRYHLLGSSLESHDVANNSLYSLLYALLLTREIGASHHC